MNSYEEEIHYRLLKVLSKDARLSQRGMASQMGISLGKVNYCLAELAKKGLIKINRFKDSTQKIKYLYHLTPRGIAARGIEARAALTVSFLKRKMNEYNEIRRQIDELTEEARAEGLIDMLGPESQIDSKLL